MAEELPEVKLLPADGRTTTGATQFGGQPILIYPSPPECCEETMTLFAQLDGLDYPEADLPDAGVVLVYLCRECYGVHASLECC
ncbi:MAG: hypothetical protein ACRC8S_16960 [Fimbriiglobus sp.]